MNIIDKEWISLCRVNRMDKNGQIWMVRIADLEAGNLTAYTFDPSKPSSFENRRLLFRNDGPNTVNSIGFWRWHEVEKPAGSGQWRSISQYIEEMTPIEIIDLGTQTSLRDVIDKLKTGLNIPVYIQGNILFISTIDQKLIGIFCNLKDFDVGKVKAAHDVFISIKKTKYTLPYYSINEENIISWDYRKVYSHISMGEPIGMATLQIPVDAIRQILLDRFTNWPVFKAQGISKGDWQKFKEFLRSIPVETLYSELSSAYGMSLEEVANCIDGFLKSAESYIDATDIDSLLFPQLIDNHKVIRDLLYEKAEEKWREENKKALEQAEKRLAEIRLDTDQEQRTAKQQLANVHKEITTAKEQHDDILYEIESAKNELEQLRISIRENEILGNNTVSAIRQRITDAQKDMAGFIADLSVFLPQVQPQTPGEPQTRVSLWQYECASSSIYTEDEVELSENWGDELNAISQNLAHSTAINGDLSGMLSAFLYATHINEIPLLIAGPSGRELSEIMAVSLYASGAGHLWLGNEPANNIAEAVSDCDERIVSVHNMFGKGWQDELPQSFAKLKKQIIWTHPYVEDMVIEPKGMLNYMHPILSECFIESIPMREPWPNKRAEKFKAYAPTKKQPLKIGAFKKLKLSKLLVNRRQSLYQMQRQY